MANSENSNYCPLRGEKCIEARCAWHGDGFCALVEIAIALQDGVRVSVDVESPKIFSVKLDGKTI